MKPFLVCTIAGVLTGVSILFFLAVLSMIPLIIAVLLALLTATIIYGIVSTAYHLLEIDPHDS